MTTNRERAERLVGLGLLGKSGHVQQPDPRTIEAVVRWLRAEGDKAIQAGANAQCVALKLAAARISKGAVTAVLNPNEASIDD